MSKIRMVEESLDAPNTKDDESVVVTDYLKVVNIDPQLCSCYDSNLVLEVDLRPSTDYMLQVQRDIDPNLRRILINKLVQLSEALELASDTLFLTVNLIDRFLSHNYIEETSLLVLGVICMFIASKYEDTYAPPLEHFCVNIDDIELYTRRDLVCMEMEVLNLLNFRLSVPTTKTFLTPFIQIAQASDDDKAPYIDMELLANYLAELTLVEYSFLRFLPSLIAASAVFLARWTLDQSNHPWNPTLEHYTRYETSALKSTVLAMEDLQLKTSERNREAVRSKYNQEKFKRVATLKSPQRVTTIFSQDDKHNSLASEDASR